MIKCGYCFEFFYLEASDSILCHNYFIFNVRRYSFCSGVIL
jgi:hypothetical protein